MTSPNSNVQLRRDVITLCPWYLQSLRQNGNLHLSEELVDEAIGDPGGNIAEPDIDALTSLDTTMLHEVKRTTFRFCFY